LTSRVRQSKALIVYGACCTILATLSSFANAATIEVFQTFDSVYPGLSNEEIIILVSQGDELAQHEYSNQLATGSGDLPVNQSAAAAM